MNKYYKSLLIAVLSVFSFQSIQAQTITGRILDELGEPLPGANILVKEQPKIGTVTNFDGYYTLTGFSPGKITLIVSFIGYADKQIEVDASSGGEVKVPPTKLEESSNNLDEVVVVGYGVQRKRESTGTVVSLDSKDINDIPTPSFENAIQGKAPGVQIITGSGLAASPSIVRIRGISSISAAGDPLYVVDGIPISQDFFTNGNSGGMNTNPLASINPNDIESIDILKDASATAIYGSRGANGVIIITTKRGRQKGLRFGFTSTLGVSQPTKVPEMLNSSEYLQLFEEAWINDGNTGTPSFPSSIPMSWEEAKKYDTDWVDQTIGTGFKQFYDFNVQKGSKDYNYYVGLSYDINESYLLGNSYERLSGRLNGDYRVNDKLKIGVSTSLSRGDNNRVDAAWSGGLGAAMSTALPIYPIYYDEDEYSFDGNGDSTLTASKGDYWLKAGIGNNPVANRELKSWRVREYRSINSVNVNYTPIENLSFIANGSYDYMGQIEDVHLTGSELHGFEGIGGVAFRSPRQIHNYSGFVTGSYNWKINEDNNITFLLGTEYQQSQNYVSGITTLNEDSLLTTINYVLDVDDPYYNLENKENYDFDSTWLEPNKRFNFLSYFTRVNYSYKNKYFVQGVFRTDGSSKFGPNKRFGYFPSISGGWIMSEEKFLKYNAVVNYLKLKASYGYVGSAGLPPNAWRSIYAVSNTGYNNSQIVYPTLLENPNLQWESSTVFDLGVEYGLLEDRIVGEISYYHKRSKDVFLSITPPSYNGTGQFWDNVGEILNEGVEFSITSRNLVGEFQWTTNFNIAYNYNELVSIGGYSEDAVSGGTNDTRTVIGKPVGTNFLVRFSHVDEETGAPVYLDINGEETLTWDPKDRVAVGKVLPDAIGGITNTFRYKGLDLSFLFVYSIGGNIYDSSSKRQLGVVDEWNKTPLIFDRWQEPGDEATYAKLTLDRTNLGSTTPWINTDLWLHDASYARLRNLTIGYTLPRKAVQRMKLTTCRISLTGSNLLTFTNYPGIDPEIARDFENATDRNMSPNISYLTPPQEKTYTLSINLTF